MNFMKFDKIFDPQSSNADVFQNTAKKLCDNMVETGFNSLLFAYGQTGSGKTHTLLGTHTATDFEKGVLALTIEYLSNHPSGKVHNCTLSAIEVYGKGANKIQIIDLFSEPLEGKVMEMMQENSVKSSDGSNYFENDENNEENFSSNHSRSRKRSSSIIGGNVIKKDISNLNALIETIRNRGQHARTGKNPNSSRGHTAFVIEVHLEDGHQCNFLCLDLAGSEGKSAITPDFQKAVGQKTANIRIHEAAAINYGLGQIREILKEVGTKRGVKPTKGNGLRKLLWKYLQRKAQPLIHILFTLSPSTSNVKATRDTLRVAEVLANLKTHPMRFERNKPSKIVVEDLRRKTRELELIIIHLRQQIQELDEENKTFRAREREMSSDDFDMDSDEFKELGDAKTKYHQDVNAIQYNVSDLEIQRDNLILERDAISGMLQDQWGDEESNEDLREELAMFTTEIGVLDVNIIKFGVALARTVVKVMSPSISMEASHLETFKSIQGVGSSDFVDMSFGDRDRMQHLMAENERLKEENSMMAAESNAERRHLIAEIEHLREELANFHIDREEKKSLSVAAQLDGLREALLNQAQHQDARQSRSCCPCVVL